MTSGKKACAYTHTEFQHGEWSVVICEEGVQGYRPVPDYGPYEDEARAKGIAQRLNARLGVSEKRATDIVRSTMLRANVKAIDPLLQKALDTLHNISSAYLARRVLLGTHNEPPANLTGPLRKSMQAKALTDEAIEKLALDTWEEIVTATHEKEKDHG